MTEQPLPAGPAPDWWDPEWGDYIPQVERIARIIDPEAFGLPSWRPASADYLTDRDEAREKAVAIIRAIRDA